MKKSIRFLAMMMTLLMFLQAVAPVDVSAAGIGDYIFDWQHYYQLYPDLQKAFGRNSAKLLNHYKTFGKIEGRIPSDIFDPVYYLNAYPDLKAAFGTNYVAAYDHYITHGIREGRRASASFSIEVYKANYLDLRNAFGTAASDNWEYVRHWATFGRKEGRNAVSSISNSNGAPASSQTKPSSTVNAKENGVNYTYITGTLDTSNLQAWTDSFMLAHKKIDGAVVEITVKERKAMNVTEPLQGPPVNGKSPTRTKTIQAPSRITFKVHKHERVMGYGRSVRYANGCIITSYSCNCGYNSDILAWEIPLPDPSEFITKQILNSIKYHNQQSYWINNHR